MPTPTPQLILLAVCLALSGCVRHRAYHAPGESIESIKTESPIEGDVAVIEFDDHGSFWEIDHLNDAIELIRQRNLESERGILVILYTHGWKHNADPERAKGNLAGFKQSIANIADRENERGGENTDHVIGVYLGWRGATTRVPYVEQTTFWDRRATAERVASNNMREAFFRVMEATKENPLSKCYITGHSMGGLIVGKTLSPAVTTLLLASGEDGVRLPADLAILLNPALDGLASYQFIDFLKRTQARVELRRSNGIVTPAPGPIIVSVTSEADTATKNAYALGQSLDLANTAFQPRKDKSVPSQRYLATHAEGHIDYLISHRAWMENGELKLERVEDAWNDTPFWIIQVSKEISTNHDDVGNPNLGQLLNEISELNGVYDADIQTWLIRGDRP